MTMSISVAPSATAWRVSTSLASKGARPDGNAVATEATSTPVPRRAVTALATMSGYTHTAPTVGTVRSAGSGWAALVHSARTLPGVSAPSRVVRSTMEMARSMAVALVVVLTDRVDRSLARAVAPTSSTPGSPYRYARSERLVIASGAVVVWARAPSGSNCVLVVLSAVVGGYGTWSAHSCRRGPLFGAVRQLP